MSKVSVLIKICKIKKLPLDIEDLIFEYLEGKKIKIYLQVDDACHLLSQFRNNCWNKYADRIGDYLVSQMDRYLRKETDFHTKFYLNLNEEFKVRGNDDGELSNSDWALINMAYMVLHC
jgi:hypothetical protein